MSFIIKAPIVDGVVCPKNNEKQNNESDTLKSEEKSNERSEERTEERMEEKKKECVKMEISKKEEKDEFDNDDYDYDSDENDLESLIIRKITPEMRELMKRDFEEDKLEKPKKKQKTEMSEIDAYLGYESEWTEESYKRLKRDYYTVEFYDELYEKVFLYDLLDNGKKEYIGVDSGYGVLCGPQPRWSYDYLKFQYNVY